MKNNPAGETRIALKYTGKVDPGSIDSYLEAGGYDPLKKALSTDPEVIIDQLTKASLRGRGGAGFPTGIKEQSTFEACAPCDRFIVCNADEGEPGTFKDRIIMETEPHVLLEGMIISAYAVGAERGFIYIRGEYVLSIDRVQNAIHEARNRGFLGKNIAGTSYIFDIEIRLGAGSYLCGEELTLLESLEGKRGYPRIKPPFPAEHGLWGKPTLVNNVETLANVPWIIAEGADRYLDLGTPASPGTKIFTISGDVNKPGAYETEMGIPLKVLIDDFAGGITGGERVKAVLLGGAAGTFVPEEMLDVKMDFDSLKKADAVLGSGAVIVLNETRNLFEMLTSIMDFFRHESCGKCIPCRVGTFRLAETASGLEKLSPEDQKKVLKEMIRDAGMIAKSSLCPLGQSPILPLKSVSRCLWSST